MGRLIARLSAATLLLACAQPIAVTAAPVTQNLILVTLDGVRIQEFFSGMDSLISAREEDSGIYEIAVTRVRYWRDTETQRREALMPFFWRQLAPMGIVLGNKARGSSVTVRNPYRFSSPGYSEILTGQPQPDVRSNDLVRYPHETVLDYLHRRLQFRPTDVAQVGSWDGFKMAASRADGTFFMNGAYDAVPAALSTAEMDYLVNLRRQVMEMWEESSNDVLTFRLGLAYLKKHQPRVLWLGFGQSDDWAHARRYDRLLDYLRLADGLLEELWQALESIERYRGRTTLIITTDHGRGITAHDWIEHDAPIAGSEDIWIAIIGPDTPDRGEVTNHPPVSQGQIAATMLQFFGQDYREFNPNAGPPIPGSMQ
jgi:hypothetical protein